MRIGAHAWLWVAPFTTEKIPLLSKIAEMGFDWVELGIESPNQMDYREVRAALEDAGLGISISAITSADRDLTIDDASVNRNGIEYLKHCVDAIRTLGGRVIAGPIYASVGRLWQADADQRRRDMDRCVKNIREVAAYANDKGAVFGVESLNRFETSFINTIDQAIELVERVDSPAVQMMADTFHMNIEEKDVAASLEKIGKRLVHVHANENDRGAPGSGHVDWEGVGRALKKIDYDGALVIESFSASIKEIARAAAVWRPLAPTQDDLARDGLAFLKKLAA